jgi:hypothetical protein
MQTGLMFSWKKGETEETIAFSYKKNQCQAFRNPFLVPTFA